MLPRGAHVTSENLLAPRPAGRSTFGDKHFRIPRDYGPGEIARCLPLFTLAMQGTRPTERDIMLVLMKVGIFPPSADDLKPWDSSR
jgi:hypothetical protein